MLQTTQLCVFTKSVIMIFDRHDHQDDLRLACEMAHYTYTDSLTHPRLSTIH